MASCTAQLEFRYKGEDPTMKHYSDCGLLKSDDGTTHRDGPEHVGHDGQKWYGPMDQVTVLAEPI